MFTVHNKVYYIGVALGLLSMGNMSVAHAGARGIVFEDGFENGVVNKPPTKSWRDGRYWWGGCSGNCAQVSTDRAKTGKKSLKVYLNRYDSKSKYRTEAVPRVKKKLKQGDDLWYRFSIYVPRDHVPDWSKGAETVAQWHHNGTGGGVPPLALFIEGSKWRIINRWSSGEVGRGKGRPQGSKSYRVGEIVRGRWVDWVFHVKWFNNNKGLLQVWKNGRQVVNRKGPNNYLEKTGKAPYLKLGIYKWVWKSPKNAGKRYDASIFERTYYYDDVRIAVGTRLAMVTDPVFTLAAGNGYDFRRPSDNGVAHMPRLQGPWHDGPFSGQIVAGRRSGVLSCAAYGPAKEELGVLLDG